MNIEFFPSDKKVELVLDLPKPSKSFIPKWYKNIKSDKSMTFNEHSKLTNVTIKDCIPFLDAMMHGYIQSTWCDIFITKNEDGTVNYNCSGTEVLPLIMGNRVKSTPIDSSQYYYDIEFFWNFQWIPQTPKGWSILIVPPLNHFDSPFTVTSGIIDSDVFHHAASGKLPFYIKKDFEGLIPKGTPMYQIIPIKRASWTTSKQQFNEDEIIKRKSKYLVHFTGAYKKLFWQKKDFS